MYRYTTPAAVVKAKSENDVRSTIVFAHKNKLRLTVKNGGHSYMGYCLNEGGIVLDLSHMNTCHIDNENMLIHMDAGLIWKEVYDKHLEDKRNIVIGGQCPYVGVSGFTLGAGLSPFSRSYGLGCDNLVEMTIVTWDGKKITVSRDDKDAEKKELFWVLAGGGGGNFGVTVSMTSKFHKLNDDNGHVVCGRLVWNLPQQKKDFEDMMNAFNTTKCPKALTLDAFWSHTKNKQLTGSMTVIYNGAMGKAREALGYLLAFKPIIELEEMEWTNWVHKSEGWDPKSQVFHHHASFIFAEGAITRELTAKISHIVEEATKVVGITDDNESNSPKCHVLWDHIGGATEEGIAPDATPFPWRQGHYVSNIKMQWTCPKKTKKVHDFIRKCQAELLPHAIEQKAAYINYIDRNVRNWQEAYYGANYRRLQEIKTKWDPHNFFWNWQSIELIKDGKTVPNPGSVEEMESWWKEYASLVDPEQMSWPETEKDVYERDAKLRKKICGDAQSNGTVTA
ncbi:isoamyl alcohol oxidase [Fusarium globosum]|uniref:Isoamyl alcohol oxidase n=1 Tax=Fusarium globosum TaxID=78864 RepID=A0A8H5XU96_9HYPO|nr:isoamyl alcohol oxidase [Fusarium globosum]